MRSEKTRKGRGLTTKLYSDSHGSTSESTFFEVDNLDTKTLEEAENNYEKSFVVIRNYLEEQKDGQHNISSEAARLTLTQDIVDLLRENSLIRKGGQ